MSERYPGGIITKTPGTPTGPYQNGTAPGIWTLDQQLQFQQQGIWPIAGNVPPYIEDVFSTYLYTGTGNGTTGSQTITNGINLSANGGMVWIKARNAATDHDLFDTSRGVYKYLISNNTDAQHTANTTNLTAFNTNGFSLGPDSTGNVNSNDNGAGAACTYASWTFRKQAKFFDVVTWTGDGTSSRTISHNLGSTPGFLIVKRTDSTSNWPTLHIAGYSGSWGQQNLNTTNAFVAPSATYFGDGTSFIAPTSTSFTAAININASSGTYVAYLFASNAGGFGNAGTDNVITCGSFTTDGSGNATVNLGYEPQWVMIKPSSTTGSWFISDVMRGMPNKADSTNTLSPNTSAAESANNLYFYPTSTGFQINGTALSATFIYIAIRRGPMKTPTTGTSVFSPISSSAATDTAQTTNFRVDMQWVRSRSSADTFYVIDRLRGISTTPTTASSRTLDTTDASSEYGTDTSNGWNNTGFSIPTQQGGASTIYESFQRAPGFFDEVCYTGTGSATTITHNLGVAPEMMIVKCRSNGSLNWSVYNKIFGASYWFIMNLDLQALSAGASFWNSTDPTSTVFSVGGNGNTSGSGFTYVAYLFATLAGVSKVGSYTGTGGTQTINCGFGAGGARWLMVKRTDSTGNWYVFDSARGFTISSSPYLLANSTAAETTGNNGCYADSTGFTVTSTANATVNINGASYIFLAIA